MDITTSLKFKAVRGDREYAFYAPAGSPIGEIYDVAFELLGQTLQIAQDSVQKAAPKEVPSTPVADQE